jgi:hypothetical protein
MIKRATGEVGLGPCSSIRAVAMPYRFGPPILMTDLCSIKCWREAA